MMYSATLVQVRLSLFTVFAVDKEGHVRQWVGYRNTLTLDADVNNIHAMYAVATNTNANRDDKTYWVADGSCPYSSCRPW